MIYTIKRHANANSSREEKILDLRLFRLSILKKNSFQPELRISLDLIIPFKGFLNIRFKKANCKIGFSVYWRWC